VSISGVPISEYDRNTISGHRVRSATTACTIFLNDDLDRSPAAFRGGDPPPVPFLQECLNLCMSWSLEGLATLHPRLPGPRAVLSVRSAPDERVRIKDSKASCVGCLRGLFVQDLPILVATRSRVLFLEFHADHVSSWDCSWPT
jgi:hypothetical protein